MSRPKHPACLAVLIALAACTAVVAAPDAPKAPDHKSETEADRSGTRGFEPFKVESVTSTGSVTIGGRAIAYQAVAGTLIIHPKGWDDVPHDPVADKAAAASAAGGGEPPNPTAEASMFYVAYFRNGAGPRPLTFFYNGGPGSSTMWLHMGAFGPRRIVTATDAHTAAAPYPLINNAYSLLDATDMVFVDAPGTGFSRIAGKDKEKAFFGVDPDAYAFAEFITQFLSKYGRWNSAKFLFGESYGTPRSAVVVNQLESDRAIDLNGVILLTGRLDSRFSGPDLDPLSQRADYDPQAAALSSAYVTAFNEYARKELRYGEDKAFKASAQLFRTWNFSHQQPGETQVFSARQGTNVMPDLANAMKLNPNLKVQLHAGYFDLATPFYQGIYEMHHLPIPQSLQANIEYCFYESGHMVYAKDASLRQLHDNVADFIRRTGRAVQ